MHCLLLLYNLIQGVSNSPHGEIRRTHSRNSPLGNKNKYLLMVSIADYMYQLADGTI
jgi:hypothetical protein